MKFFNVIDFGLFFLSCIIQNLGECFPLSKEIKDIDDICFENDHVYNLDDNKSFKLSVKSPQKADYNDKRTLQKLKKKCSIILKVCPSCHVSITISNMTIPPCSECSCNYFKVTELLSEYDREPQLYCGFSKDAMYYQSQTKTVRLEFLQSIHMEFYISLIFNVSRNIYLYTEGNIHNPFFLETPNFPEKYPSDYGADYKFQARGFKSIVKLLFIDFQLSKFSTVEISNHNGTRTSVYSGDDARPPAIISEGSIYLKFRANDRTSGRGFRVQVSFERNLQKNNILKKPQTNCGGDIEGFGGPINLKRSDEGLFDCIWVIHPPLFTPKSLLLSVKILNFSSFGQNSILTIRRGLTSKSEALEVYNSSNFSTLIKSEVNTPAEFGLFVRFRGFLTSSSLLQFTYVVFHLKPNCSNDEHKCYKRQCIKKSLRCNGFPDCLDDLSDEIDCPSNILSFHNETTTRLSTSVKEPPFKFNLNGVVTTLICLAAFGVLFIIIVVKVIFMQQYILCNYFNSPGIPPVTHSIEHTIEHSVPRQLPPLQSPYNILFSNIDTPPSYYEVSAHDDRYPPLFYTRSESLQDEANLNNLSMNQYLNVQPLQSASVLNRSLRNSVSLDLELNELPNYFSLYRKRFSSLPNIMSL